jgi:hypothetical protein
MCVLYTQSSSTEIVATVGPTYLREQVKLFFFIMSMKGCASILVSFLFITGTEKSRRISRLVVEDAMLYRAFISTWNCEIEKVEKFRVKLSPFP